jgi:hypothetical protein
MNFKNLAKNCHNFCLYGVLCLKPFCNLNLALDAAILQTINSIFLLMKNLIMPYILILLYSCNALAQLTTVTPTTEKNKDNEVVLSNPKTFPSPSTDSQTAITKPNVDTVSSGYVRKDAPVKIPHFETAPVIDGQLNDNVWQTAALFGDFVQTQPGDNVAPKHQTEFMMGYDSKNLYMAFRIKQDKNTVRATLARRDNIFNDDYVLVHLDTFNDQRQAYLLFFNPLGIQADGTFTEGRGEDYSVDIIMESKGVLTEDGFTIEVAIPFKSLRYEAGKNKQWGLHINRRVKIQQ